MRDTKNKSNRREEGKTYKFDMGKKKQRYTSFHLHLSNQLKHLPRKLAHLRSDPPVMEGGTIFDSFRSLGLSDCNLNSNDQMQEAPAQYNNTAVMVPPSDRFFVSPSTSGSLAAWGCNCKAPLQEDEDEEEEEELTVTLSYPRFFVSPSTSGLITLDQRVKSSEVVAVSPFTSSSNSTSSDHESVLASSSSALELDGTLSSSSDHTPLINIPGDGIAVSTDSNDPYQDFKQSMQEMLHQFEGLDWDLLEELLFCYLELNDRSMHRFIIKAFADVVVAALQPPCCQIDRSIDGEEDQVN